MTAIQENHRPLLGKNDWSRYTSTWEVVPSSHSTEYAKPRSITISDESDTGEVQEGSGVTFFLTKTSTEQFPDSDHIDAQLEALFRAFRNGFLEEQETKEFSEKLSSLVKLYGDAAISSLAPFVIGNRTSAETAAEALSCLSHLESSVSHNFRIWLMERALQASSSWIRDAATLSLEAMDDPSSIPYLVEANREETNLELRQYMQSVLDYLQRKR